MHYIFLGKNCFKHSWLQFLIPTHNFLKLGFGICCLFVVSTTGATIEQNCTYIQNPGFPSTLSDSTSLSYTVKKCSCGKNFLELIIRKEFV